MIKRGFIPDIIEQDHYILGASTLPKIILRPDGQWLDFAPKPEDQKIFTETYNCTAFNTLEPVEILCKEALKEDKNFSDRFLGIVAGTFPPGNSPHKVAEALRKNGVVEEAFLPFSDDITTPEQYYSPNPPTQDLIDEANKFLKFYDFGHEWVFTFETGDEIKRMKEALQYSPLGASVYAWEQQGELFIRPLGAEDTHWTCIAGYKDNEYWIALDSYAPYVKKLDWNFNFGQVKRYHIAKKNLSAEETKILKVSIIRKLINLLTKLIKWTNT